ncbi:MAG: hypothetical protein AVDCRST_MAG88-3184, partial [uncultured Thermomicrobiales bacterium]
AAQARCGRKGRSSSSPDPGAASAGACRRHGQRHSAMRGRV